MHIETQQHAPQYMQTFAAQRDLQGFKVMLIARDYGFDRNGHVRMEGPLRDRTDDFARMLKGFGGDTTYTYVVKGNDLRLCGWELAGASLSQDFVVMVRV